VQVSVSGKGSKPMKLSFPPSRLLLTKSGRVEDMEQIPVPGDSGVLLLDKASGYKQTIKLIILNTKN